MEMKKIKLVHGFVTVPNNINVVNICKNGDADHVAVISDRAGVLPPLLVVSDISFSGISSFTEDSVVRKAINGLEAYQIVKAQELPYPHEGADNKAWIEWNDSFRLGLFPAEMFAHMDVDGYQLHRD